MLLISHKLITNSNIIYKKKCQKNTRAVSNSLKSVIKKKKNNVIEMSKGNKTEIMTIMKIVMMKMEIMRKKWKANGKRLRNLKNVLVCT